MGKHRAHMAHRFAFAVIFAMLAIVASAKLGSASESMPASNTNMDASYKMTTDVVPEIMIDENHPDHDNLVQAQEAAGSKTEASGAQTGCKTTGSRHSRTATRHSRTATSCKTTRSRHWRTAPSCKTTRSRHSRSYILEANRIIQASKYVLSM